MNTVVEEKREKLKRNDKFLRFSKALATNIKDEIGDDEITEFTNFKNGYSPCLYMGIYADYQCFGLSIILNLRKWGNGQENLFVLLENRGSGFKSLNEIKEKYKSLFDKYQLIYNAFSNNEFVSHMINQKYPSGVVEVDDNFSLNGIYILKSLLKDGIIITSPQIIASLSAKISDYNPKSSFKVGEVESIFLALSAFKGDDSFFTNMYVD